MNERALRNAALRCIQDHIARRSAFTAYNITCRLQADGCGEPHGRIRGVVHGLWREGAIGPGYGRTLAPVVGATRAFVYHPGAVYNGAG